MNFDLEELRAQRELLRKHLHWLESKIAALENRPGPQGGEQEPAPPPPPPPVKPAAPVAPAQPAVPQPDAAKTADLPIPSVGSLRAQSASDIKRARFGCLFLFVAACGLFLFLLFGLPYLIDSDDAEPDAVEEPVR